MVARWMTEAEKYLGLREVPGRLTNPQIAKWWELLRAPFNDDETPWCGAFTGGILAQCGLPAVEKPYWALNWASYGQPLRRPEIGAIAVFRRKGGGHVGFYAGRQGSFPVILGGNQGDKVSKAVIALELVSYRWPPREPLSFGSTSIDLVAPVEKKVT